MSGTVDFAEGFHVLFGFKAGANGIVSESDFAGGIVAVFLELMELRRETSELGGAVMVFVGIGGKEFGGLRGEEELGQARGGDLKADFRGVGGVAFA